MEDTSLNQRINIQGLPFLKGMTRERLGKFGLQWPVKEDGTDTQILHTEEFTLGKGRLKTFDWKDSTEI